MRRLLEEGITTVPFPQQLHVPQVINGFKRFLALSQEEKERWTCDCGDGDPDLGYIDRRYDVNKDPKEFFHFRRHLGEELGRRGVSTQGFDEWLRRGETLRQQAQQVVEQYVAELARLDPDLDFRDKVSAGRDESVLRLIMYKNGGRNGETIGRAHADKAFLTLHLAELRPGLHVGVEGDERLMPCVDGQAFLFAGLKAEVESQQRLKALRHLVTEKDASADESRWVVVFFCHTSTNLFGADTRR